MVLSVGRRLFGPLFGLVSYTLENVVIKDLEPFAPLIIVRQALENGGEATTSALSLALTRDTRDSSTEPTRGNRSRIAATYAGGFLGFDNNFNKYSVGDFSVLADLVEAGGKRAGHILVRGFLQHHP